MKHKRQNAVVNFTIHTLRLPEDIQDPFQIEFKRGNTNGMTEKSFVDDHNEVHYEKNFRVCVTLVRPDEKSRKEFKKKKIAFTVYRFRDTSRKVFGKFTINATKYMKSKTDTFEVESPHAKKSFVIMSINVTLTTGSMAGSGGTDLDSQSEAIQLQTDRQDEWDVSDMVTPEGKERIQNFFMKREAEKNEQRSRLSDFAQISHSEGRSRTRNSKRTSINLLTVNPQIASSLAENKIDVPLTPGTDKSPKNKISNFLTKKQPRKRAPVPAPYDTRKNDESLDYEGINDSEKISDSKDDKKNLKKDKSQTVSKKETDLRFLRSVMAKIWDNNSPIQPNGYPKTAAAVVAAFLHTKMLESNDDDHSLIYEFNERYKSSVMLSNFSESYEKAYVTTMIIATMNSLKETLNLNQNKVDILVSGLTMILLDQFNEFIIESFAPFQQIGENLILGTFDESKVAKTLNDSILLFQDSIKLDKDFINFYTEKIIHIFDKLLLKTVLDHPERCSFNSAVQWNTVITVLSDYEVIKLPLFRETASVLMMSMMLCGDPQTKNDICPDLKPELVYKLLQIQQVDDFLPSPNDPTMFQEHFHLIVGACEPSIELTYDGNFDLLLEKLNVSEWKNVTFTSDVLEAFPYLTSYFSTK